jgi:hypothetical protein
MQNKPQEKHKEKIAQMWGIERKPETKVSRFLCWLGVHDESWYQRLSGLYNAWVCRQCLHERYR